MPERWRMREPAASLAAVRAAVNGRIDGEDIDGSVAAQAGVGELFG